MASLCVSGHLGCPVFLRYGQTHARLPGTELHHRKDLHWELLHQLQLQGWLKLYVNLWTDYTFNS